MALVDLFVNKNYLIDLDRCEPIALESAQKSFSYLSLFEISKIVYDTDENINDKLVSVYNALSKLVLAVPVPLTTAMIILGGVQSRWMTSSI